MAAQSLDNLTVDAELLWLKLDLGKNRITYLGAYYNPHTSKTSLQELDKSLSTLHSTYGNSSSIWLAGDFNLRDIDWVNLTVKANSPISSQCHLFLDICSKYQLAQTVKIPTRKDKTLDLFLTTNPTLVNHVETLPGLGDHDLVKILCDVKPHRKRRAKRKIFQYSKGNMTSLRKDLSEFGTNMIKNLRNNSVQVNWNNLSTKIVTLMEKYIPTKMSSQRHNLPWFNRRLKCKKRKLQRLYNKHKISKSDHDEAAFKSYRSNYKKEIRHAQGHYIRNTMSDNLHQNTKQFWKIVKSKRVDNGGIPPLNTPDGNTTDVSQDKAEILNNYFRSVYTHEDTANIPNLSGNPYPEMPPINVTPEGVEKLLADLQPNKASGPDQLPARILKENSKELAPILSAIFNQSLDTGELPNDWLMSHITPIFKKGNKNLPCNYRPIALTSICCKILEHILTSNIMNHLDKYDILADAQHGFRKRRGCDTQLTITIGDLAKSFDNKHQVDVVLLDFSKAFDRVPHTRLLNKIHHYGIRGKEHNWINTFLTHRKQRVTLDGKLSSTADVTSSVPQGTVIGPLCFLIYINNMPDCVSEGTKIRLFADDALIYREINSNKDKTTFQNDLDALSRWSADWQMSFNTAKCHTMHFTAKRSPCITPYKLCGNTLQVTSTHPYLGITFSSDLKWKTHINNVTKSSKMVIGVIRRNFKACTPDVKSRLYLSLVQPKLEYGTAAWYPSTQKEKLQLDKVQRSAARMCLSDYSWESSVSAMIKSLKWTDLETRRTMVRLALMYKVNHNIVDIDWKPHLTRPIRNTRCTHPSTFTRPSTTSTRYSDSFFPWTAKHWNALPHHILDAPTLNIFKSRLCDFFSHTTNSS